MKIHLTVSVVLPEHITTEEEAHSFICDMDYGFSYNAHIGEEEKEVYLDTEIIEVTI